MDIDRMEFKVNNLKERVEELCDKSSAYVRYIVLSVLGLVISLGNIISNMLFGFDNLYEHGDFIIYMLIFSSFAFFMIRAMKRDVDRDHLIAKSSYMSALIEIENMKNKSETSTE